MKFLSMLMMFLLMSSPLIAQGNYDDYIQSQSKKYKAAGITMLVSGIVMIGGGVAMMTNESNNAKAMGGVLAAGGVGLDVASIIIFNKRKKLLENANDREQAPVSFYISPMGAKFTYRF